MSLRRSERLHRRVEGLSHFRQLASLHGPPPKVAWLRFGNVTTGEQFATGEDEALLVLTGI